MIEQYPKGTVEIDIQVITDCLELAVERLRQMVKDEAPPADLFRQIDKVEDQARNLTVDLA